MMKLHTTLILMLVGTAILVTSCTTQSDRPVVRDNTNPAITHERIVPTTGQKIPVTTKYDPVGEEKFRTP